MGNDLGAISRSSNEVIRIRGWKTGCAYGCGVPSLLAVIGLLGMILVANGISKRAVETRLELESRFPSQSDYRPPMDDRLVMDRIERFIQIRQRLEPYCEDLMALDRLLTEADALSEEMESRPEGELRAHEFFDFVIHAGRAGTSLFRVGPAVAEYGRIRNEALLELEMGHGEYTWIFAIVNFGLLGQDPQPFPVDQTS